uniref:Uncharacterized protein n=1 Tax=Rhizophora mucronata TaxID=61149 RepID=A0A2P2P8Z7_RHIMU
MVNYSFHTTAQNKSLTMVYPVPWFKMCFIFYLVYSYPCFGGSYFMEHMEILMKIPACFMFAS